MKTLLIGDMQVYMIAPDRHWLDCGEKSVSSRGLEDRL